MEAEDTFVEYFLGLLGDSSDLHRFRAVWLRARLLEDHTKISGEIQALATTDIFFS